MPAAVMPRPAQLRITTTGGGRDADPVDGRVTPVISATIAPWGTIVGGDPVVASTRR